MNRFTGMKAARGIATGPVKILTVRRTAIERYAAVDTEKERRRLADAKQTAAGHLMQLYELSVEKLGEEDSAVFKDWKLLLEDVTLLQAVEDRIETEKLNAEAAVCDVIEQYAQTLQNAEEQYMRDRAGDLREVEEYLLAALKGEERDNIQAQIQTPSIIISRDITPEQMVRLDRKCILAFVTAGGSVRSHAAIMARIMGVPAVVSVGREILNVPDGEMAAVDGYTGEVFVQPDTDVIEQLEQKRQQEEETKKRLRHFRDVDAVTKHGKKINVYANISSEEELDLVLENGAGGIGLFRSEWLYLERSAYPSEEMQYIAYRKVLQAMDGRPVTIRTLDVGGDKKAEYMHFRKEDNPALGYRGIRVCFDQEEMFKTQLRALYRASVHGRLSILFPMITSVGEVRRIQKIVREVKEELTKREIAFAPVRLGIMIETPAAAIISDLLAPEVDFFSIGTNDLAQYTLAADRQNPAMEPYYDGAHEAVLRLVDMAAKQACRHQIEVCVCGELGADLSVTQRLLDMGVDCLSVNPSQILRIKEKILSCE